MFSAVAIMTLVLSPVLIPAIITGFHFVAGRWRSRSYSQLEQKLERDHLADRVGRGLQTSMSTA